MSLSRGGEPRRTIDHKGDRRTRRGDRGEVKVRVGSVGDTESKHLRKGSPGSNVKGGGTGRGSGSRGSGSRESSRELPGGLVK